VSELARERVTEGTANVSYEYYCRECRGTLFRVAWYAAPLAPDGTPRPPGWAIECSGCSRVTLIPDAPDPADWPDRGAAENGP
jgi:hypothetical protein